MKESQVLTVTYVPISDDDDDKSDSDTDNSLDQFF